MLICVMRKNRRKNMQCKKIEEKAETDDAIIQEIIKTTKKFKKLTDKLKKLKLND